MKSLRIILSSILILIITFIAFTPSLKNGFVNWDDEPYVTENPLIRQFSGPNIVRVFSTFFLCTYLPVTMLSYMLDYRFSGMDPFGYHLTSLIFHLLNCLLAFWLIRSLSRNTLVAFVAAILFGTHPLHVESVAWVSERKDVLYTCFLLLSMICYGRYLQAQKIGRNYWFSVVFFILSLLSKGMAITLPALLFLMDYFCGRKWDRRMIADKIPFLIFAICFGVLGVYGQREAMRSEQWVSVFDKFLIASYAIVFYFGKILWPAGLSCLYPYSGVKDILIYLLSLAGCLAILIVTIRTAKHTRKAVFGILFFLITLLPVLQFVPFGTAIVADRYAYMASIGLFYLIAETVAWAYKKIAERNRLFSVVLITIFLILSVGGLSILTWKRCAVWKDGITLWNDVLEKYPCPMAYVNRGVLFAARKDYDKALNDFLKLPYHGAVTRYAYLGKLYNEMGQSDKAITVFEQSLKMGVTPALACFSLAKTYSKLGKEDVAISFYKKALEIDPGYAAACYDLGLLYKKLGKKDDAHMMLRRALEMEPDVLLAYPQLSQLYQEAGKKAEQLALFRLAIAHDIPFYDAYYDIGNLDREQGDVKSALRMFQRAIEINPASAEGYTSLGSVYCALGQTRKAISLLTRALEINSKSGVAHNNIALAYYYQKQYYLAIQHCDKAMELGYQVTPQLLELLKPFRK
jgi:tetratricopeptide (TPR) repeat protein